MKNTYIAFCFLLSLLVPYPLQAETPEADDRDIVAVVIAVKGDLELELAAGGPVIPVGRALHLPKNSIVHVKKGSEAKSPRLAVMTPQGAQEIGSFPFNIGSACFSRKGLKAVDELLGGVVLRDSAGKGIDPLFDWYLPAFGLSSDELEKGLQLVFSSEGDSLHSGSYEPLTFSLRKNARIASLTWSLCKDYSDSPVASGNAEKRGDAWALTLSPEAIGTEGSYQLVLDITLANERKTIKCLALNVLPKGAAQRTEESAQAESAGIEETIARATVLARAYRQADLELKYYAALARIGIIGETARTW